MSTAKLLDLAVREFSAFGGERSGELISPGAGKLRSAANHAGVAIKTPVTEALLVTTM
jgi:hypothetical protein